METFRQILTENKDYEKKAIKDLTKVIIDLDKKLDTDEKYEDFFSKLYNSGLDEEVSELIDSVIGLKKYDIEDKLKRGLESNYRKTGTEVRAAADAAEYEIKKLLRKI